MKLQYPESGIYVVAVSGGVDSMVLLDLLRQRPELHIIVAHFDHGIRHDSSADRELVQHVARQHGLAFVYDNGNLGPDASEARARAARYEFLYRVKQASNARAIITAHHQDDRLETALINILRGTHRRGLTALKSGTDVVRPLIHMRKAELQDYARQHGIEWREDSTNLSDAYMRNRIRRRLADTMTDADQQNAVALLDALEQTNERLDSEIAQLLETVQDGASLDRRVFVRLPHAVAREVVAAWLRQYGVQDFDATTLERLVAGMKTQSVGSKMDVCRGVFLRVGSDTVLIHAEPR